MNNRQKDLMDRVVKVVADYYQSHPSIVLEKRRDNGKPMMRTMAAMVAEEADETINQSIIANYFDIDRSTISAAIKKYKEFIEVGYKDVVEAHKTISQIIKNTHLTIVSITLDKMTDGDLATIKQILHYNSIDNSENREALDVVNEFIEKKVEQFRKAV
jgi:hypothetical protein